MSGLYELGELLDAPPANALVSDVASILHRHFGVAGGVRKLSSERDANFRIDTTSGPYLLKITNSAEDRMVTGLQTAALRHLERFVPSLPVPRIVAAQSGDDQVLEELDGKVHIVRLMSFMPGNSLSTHATSAIIRAELGRTLGQLNVGLRTFEHPAAAHDLLWNAANALRVRDAARYVEDSWKRELAEAAFDQYERSAWQAIPSVRQQIIHNDFNPHNVLIDEATKSTISGIIDFGDMLRAPLVSEIATALAYQDYDEVDPLEAVTDVVAAYHVEMPLLPQELDIMLDLIRARQVLVGVISAWRAVRHPENRAYILRNSERAWRGLDIFHDISRDEFRDKLATVCEKGAR